MTAVLDATPDAAADHAESSQPLASWQARAGAFSLDVLLGIGVIAVLVLLAYLAFTVSQPSWLWLVYVVAAAVVFVADGGEPAAVAGHHRMEPGPRAAGYQSRAA